MTIRSGPSGSTSATAVTEPTDTGPVARARALIVAQRVLTLASCRGQVPWAAPVYYIYQKKGFWFFSSPDSRHIREALDQDGRVGASVFADAPTPDRIQGLQMTGQMSCPRDGKTAMEIARDYAQQFSIMIDARTALAFIMNRFHAELYCFRPATTVFMDNSIGFGHRETIRL